MAKRKPSRPSRSAPTGVRYLEPHTNKQYDTQRRVLDALSEKRRQPNICLTEAARRCGTTVKTIRRYAGPALEVRSGRIDVRKTDRIARRLQVLTKSGLQAVLVRNSRDATRVSKHHYAVRQALLSFGMDTDQLQRFAGKTLKADGQTYEFVSDYETVVRLARAGEVNFLDIYQADSQQ